MLSCRDVTKMAGDLIDGQLPLGKKIQIKLHLVICHHCQRFMRQLNTTMHVVKELKTAPEPSPEELKQQVSRLLNARKEQ